MVLPWGKGKWCSLARGSRSPLSAEYVGSPCGRGGRAERGRMVAGKIAMVRLTIGRC